MKEKRKSPFLYLGEQLFTFAMSSQVPEKKNFCPVNFIFNLPIITTPRAPPLHIGITKTPNVIWSYQKELIHQHAVVGRYSVLEMSSMQDTVALLMVRRILPDLSSCIGMPG